MKKKIIVNTKIALGDVYVANTFVKRLIGYMFRKKPHYKAILITPCNSIHTFFMKFDIDVIFIDHNNKVIKKYSKLNSGKVIKPIKEASFVIEGENGLFDSINEGDYITLI